MAILNRSGEGGQLCLVPLWSLILSEMSMAATIFVMGAELIEEIRCKQEPKNCLRTARKN